MAEFAACQLSACPRGSPGATQTATLVRSMSSWLTPPCFTIECCLSALPRVSEAAALASARLIGSRR